MDCGPLKWPSQAAQLLGGDDDGRWQGRIDAIEARQADFRKSWRATFSGVPWLARFADGIGSEFMPELDEGDLMYMPTTLPGLSIGKAQQLLQ